MPLPILTQDQPEEFSFVTTTKTCSISGTFLGSHELGFGGIIRIKTKDAIRILRKNFFNGELFDNDLVMKTLAMAGNNGATRHRSPRCIHPH